MKEDILGNNDLDSKNLVHHKRLLNSMGLRIDQLETENRKLNNQLEAQENMMYNFFYNCKTILKPTDLLNTIQHVIPERNFDCQKIKKEYFKAVDLYHKSKIFQNDFYSS